MAAHLLAGQLLCFMSSVHVHYILHKHQDAIPTATESIMGPLTCLGLREVLKKKKESWVWREETRIEENRLAGRR